MWAAALALAKHFELLGDERWYRWEGGKAS